MITKSLSSVLLNFLFVVNFSKKKIKDNKEVEPQLDRTVVDEYSFINSHSDNSSSNSSSVCKVGLNAGTTNQIELHVVWITCRNVLLFYAFKKLLVAIASVFSI